MSRAFVKETDTTAEPALPEPELPPGARNLVTPEGAARLRDELAALEAERAALRDADGAAAAARRASVDRRARYLARRIETFVVTPTAPDVDRVVFGATVTLVGDDGERRLRIVGVDEADAARGDVSWVSPIARAVLGARLGDEVTVRVPRGDEILEVTAIDGPPPPTRLAPSGVAR